MTTQSQIDALQQQVKVLQQQQHNCVHAWGPTMSTPYETQVEHMTGRYETQGIHMYPIVSFTTVMKPRWSRTCTQCGLVQHTEVQKPVEHVTTYKPCFE